MLVLSRQKDESIMIGDNIEITINSVRGNRVQLGITAPKEIPVHRKEVYEAIKRENAGGNLRPSINRHESTGFVHRTHNRSLHRPAV